MSLSIVAALTLGVAESSGSAGSPSSAPGAASPTGAALADSDRVSMTGTYQTSFAVPVPPAPGAPNVSLSYDSGAGGSLAGVGWDLTVGWPMSITRDIRFGTPQWKLAADWVWGNHPLVRQNPGDADCATNGWCHYRTAPDTLAEVEIGLTRDIEATGPTREIGATVRLPTGTTLSYEPIVYDGTHYPSPPAGAATSVLAFRLVSATDRNGYLTCLRYEPANDPQRGAVSMLSEIAYASDGHPANCSQVFASGTRHHLDFGYDALAFSQGSGFFATWTMRYGAAMSFTKLLRTIEVHPAGRPAQDTFRLVYQGERRETHRPLLSRIEQLVPTTAGTLSARTVRSFGYGDRSAQFAAPTLIDLGPAGSMPDSLAGSVSRPMKRINPFDNPGGLVTNPAGLFQAGQDVGPDVAPPTHATSEQWSFNDVNGDGLPDLMWGKETGFGPTAPWPTFEGLAPVTRAPPPQQQILINEGVTSNSTLGTSSMLLDTGAAALSSRYPQDAPVPQTSSYSGWFWGDGRGETRTGMPVSISAAEVANRAASCPPAPNQDTRQWPLLPDGTTTYAPAGSVAEALTNIGIPHFQPNSYFGNPILGILEGIYSGFHPSYGISSSVSGWADLNGDGVLEFVATPSGIERFHIDLGCHDPKDPLGLNHKQLGARETCPASTSQSGSGPCPGPADTEWQATRLPAGSPASSTPAASGTPGPAGPVGLPLTYGLSTSDAESFGLTLPIGGIVSAVVAAAAGGGWMALAGAAPGHIMDALTPRTDFGGTLAVQGPSLTSIAQGTASLARSASTRGVGSGDIASLITSLIGLKFDLTVITATSQTRSETQAQLMDVNADGLADYVLYDSGDKIAGVPPGSLVAFLKTPTGTFSGPVVLNTGSAFRYPAMSDPLTETTDPAVLDFIDARVADAKLAISQLTSAELGAPQDKQCYAGAPACTTFAVTLGAAVAKADEAIARITPFMGVTTNAIPRERVLGEIKTMRDALAGFATAIGVLTPTWPVAVTVPDPVLGQPLGVLWPGLVDTATATAKAFGDSLGYLARTVRHLSYPSRVNMVGEGFSGMAGSPIGDSATGFAIQTKGFTDLNADGLPDYVITNDRQSSCAAGEWEVFWGTGTSSISAGRAFLAAPSCVSVPTPPPDALPAGVTTLPMGVSLVFRKPTTNARNVKTLVHSYVGLSDFNRDGLPDIVMAGSASEPWGQENETVVPGVPPRKWHVFLNTGTGFESTASMTVTSPTASRTDVEPASPDAAALDVPYPAMETTQSVGTVIGSQSRDVTETAAGMIDIDGDGVAEIARRVHILSATPGGAKREGLLVWRRSSTGPQDTMIEDGYPLEGRRQLVSYRPATAFQWNDADPSGQPPQQGHQLLAGGAAFLVRSVKTERLQGRAEQSTQVAYDYKRPFFDLTTRTFTGFAERTVTPLNPSTGEPVAASVAATQESGQRPNGVPTVTHVRRFVVGSRAPVDETLTSYAESSPTATGGAGGLDAIFATPTRTLTVEYPSDVTAGALFDLGFDGREPFRDRVTGAVASAAGARARPAAPTGGAVAFDGTRADALSYPSPHGTQALDAITIETWVKPDPGSGSRVVAEQAGAYRLLIAAIGGQDRLRLEMAGSPAVTSSEAVDAGRWQYVVASAGPGGAHLFVDGRDVGSGATPAAATPSGPLVVGCGAGTASDCFAGEIGELRIYPQAWSTAPRVKDSEARPQLADQTRADFGMTLRVLDRNDMARTDDDVATEYEYARPASPPAPRVLGLVAAETKRVLLPDGETSGNYLALVRHEYDGLAAGLASAGNETSTRQFDGPSEVTQPPQQLRVRTVRSYDPACPGAVRTVTDPGGFETTTTWDGSCGFPLATRDALGHVTRTLYYGVNPPAPASLGGIALRGHYGEVAQSIDANGAANSSTYDEWGRAIAAWKPLDREDRPGTRYEYDDAVCDWVAFSSGEPTSGSCGDERSLGHLLSPPRTTTLTWDDQLRRCEDTVHRLVACSSSAAKSFADESSTGAYRVSYGFGDGQVQRQAVAKHRPAWSVSGVVDRDGLGRAVRAYRVQYLPSGCPEAGTWCDPATAGDPLRHDAAMVQTAYDPRGRVAAVYGPTIARCPEDAVGDPDCAAQPGQTPPVDVTAIRYPAPGVAETIDAKGVPKVVKRDSRGLTTSVDEFLAPSTPVYSRLVTTYDRLGRAETVSDQNGNTSHNRYDALSRLTAKDDPDRGTTTYLYDLRSDLTEQLAATGEKTVHTYDPLSRITQTDYLRPKAGPSHPVCCNLGGEPPPRWTPRDPCYTVDLKPPPGADAGGLELNCDGGHVRLELPLDDLKGKDNQLVLRFGVFEDCGPKRTCAPGELQVGYPDRSVPGGMVPITTLEPTPQPYPGGRRPQAARKATDGESADTVNVVLPAGFPRKQPALLFVFDVSAKRFRMDFVAVGAQTVVYEPEERVLRSYDTSEPSYYVAHGATAAADAERRPLLDFPFDVPSVNLSRAVPDRSPTGSVLRCKGRIADTEAVSGHGLVLEPGTSCVAPVRVALGAPFTAELWVRPHALPARPEQLWTASKHAIVLLPNGRIACGLGGHATSKVSLPIDAWSHVALVFAAGKERCFVDGVAQATAPGSGAAITAVQVAGRSMGIDVDELRLLPAARTAEEVHEDALRPIEVGPPRGNLATIDFAHPATHAGSQSDQSKAGNDAALVGGAIVPGIQGMAFETKNGGTVRIPHSQTLRLQDAVTAELWMKRQQGAHDHARLIGKWASGGAPGWRLDLEAGSGRLRWEVVTQTTPVGGGPVQFRHEVFVTYEQIDDDHWRHVAGTYDGRRLRVFIDGVPAHRWCTSENPASAPPCVDPPKPSECTVETKVVETGAGNRTLGDAACVTGSIDNQEPVLIANDAQGAALNGLVDEARVSNYAKKEFEVAASARIASWYTQTLGAQTLLRNQLPVTNLIADQVAREHDAYDREGHIASSRRYVRHQRAAAEFVARTNFDSLNRPSQLEYPHGEVAVSGFDLDGTESSLIGYGPEASPGPAQAQAYLADATTTVIGKPADMSYGNGVISTWTYDDARLPNGGFGPDTLASGTVVSATPPVPSALSNRTYHWDVLGDLETIDDPAPAQGYSAVYGYDGLQRLKSASMTIGGNTSAYTYSSDALGNLRTKEGASQDYGRANMAGCTSVSIALPHALTRRTAAGQTARDPYCYDAAGRLVSSQDTLNNSIRRYAYFARGKPRSLQERTWESEYGYDGDGVRVWRRELGTKHVEETVPFGVYRETTDGCEATYFVGERAIARRDLDRSGPAQTCRAAPSDDVAWFTLDHLGSTNLLTDRSGGLVAASVSHYLPFGEFAGTPPQTSRSGGRQFTSKRLDATGLYDFGARPYDPIPGRFTQADDWEHSSSAQDVSPYSYVLNNPLALVDPSGHQAEVCAGECTFDVGEQIDVPEAPEITPPWRLDLNTAFAPQAAPQLPSPTTVGVAAPSAPAGPLPPQPAVDRRLTHSDLAGGIMFDVGGNGCFVVCFLLVDVNFGVYFTPPTPNDVYFGDVHGFIGFGGGFLGVTPGPPGGIDYATFGGIPGASSDVQWSLGLSAGAGGSVQFFQTEANTPDAFSGYARNVSGGLGPLTGTLAENSSGKMTGSIGVGVSHGYVAGANVYNSYTFVSPGLWPGGK